MPNQRRNEDPEQITDDEVVGRAVGEDEEFDDAYEVDEGDDEESEGVGEE